MNKKILTTFKKKVGEDKGAWLEELSGILWVLRTMPHIAMGDTASLLVYGTELVIPAKIGLRSHRTQHFSEKANQEALRLNLYLIDELRETIEVRNTTHAQQVTRYYNFKVKNKQFQVGDLVLRNIEARLLDSQ